MDTTIEYDIDGLYEVRIPDTNVHKKKLFERVDKQGDKIFHIDPKVDSEGRRRYVYAPPEAAKWLFSDVTLIPPEEILHSIKFRDYFSLERFPETRTIYCKTDFLFDGQFHQWLSRQIREPIVLLTGSADYTIDDAVVRQFKTPTIAQWFGTNVTATLPNVRGIPLGITSYDPRTTSPSFLFQYGDRTPYHQTLADDTCLTEAWTRPKTAEHRIYMNFSQGTYRDRPRIWQEFAGHPDLYAVSHDVTLDARRRFFQELRASEYSLCPRGNGIDTHRFWESLYAGTTPIVERSRVYEFFKGLPFVEWPRMTPSALPPSPPPKPYNYHKLYVSYWIEQIERASVAATVFSA